MGDQPPSDREHPANEMHRLNMPQSAKRCQERLLWEMRGLVVRVEESLLARQLMDLAASLLRAAHLRQAQEKERRRRSKHCL